MRTIGTVIFWAALFALGLLFGVPAVIYAAVTGDCIDDAANAMSGMEAE